MGNGTGEDAGSEPGKYKGMWRRFGEEVRKAQDAAKKAGKDK